MQLVLYVQKNNPCKISRPQFLSLQVEELFAYYFHLAEEKKEKTVRSWLPVCLESVSHHLLSQVLDQHLHMNKLSVDGASNYTQWSLSMGKIFHLFGSRTLWKSDASCSPSPGKLMSSQNTKTFTRNFKNFASSLKL